MHVTSAPSAQFQVTHVVFQVQRYLSFEVGKEKRNIIAHWNDFRALRTAQNVTDMRLCGLYERRSQIVAMSQ